MQNRMESWLHENHLVRGMREWLPLKEDNPMQKCLAAITQTRKYDFP